MKKEIHVIHIINNLKSGGAENVLSRLVINSSKSHLFKHEIIVLNGSENTLSRSISDNGVVVHFLDSNKYDIPLISPILKLRKILRYKSPDIIQTWMYLADIIGGFAAKSLKIRSIIWNIRGAMPAGRIKPKLILPIFSILSYFIPTKIICCGHEAAQYHSRIGYCAKKIILIPNGYPFNDDSHISEMTELLQKKRVRQSENHELTILSVARFGRLKDHRTLINAFALFNKSINAKLIMVGSGVTKENKDIQRYLSEAQILPAKVELVGEVEGLIELNKYYDKADIFCLSSLSEGFPNVLFEAMSRGCKIASTDVGDARRVFQDIGYFCEPSNHNALSSVLIKSKDREISKEYQELCIKLLHRYSLSEMILKYEDLYNKACFSDIS